MKKKCRKKAVLFLGRVVVASVATYLAVTVIKAVVK